MKTLNENNYEQVRPLMTELAAYNVAIPALLDGINPGRVFVDDLDNPQAAYIETVEGRHLVGDATNNAFVATLQAHLAANMPSWGFEVTVSSDAWVARLPHVFHPRPVQYIARRHYVCTALAYTDWRAQLPEPFVARPIDDALLDDAGIDKDYPDRQWTILDWVTHNWGTRLNYTQHGFGYCIVHQDKAISWSVADCASGSRAEIGIYTRPDYRQQGFAAITAAACVEFAWGQGFTEVGWHCDADNIGSYKTAEKVGFQHERDYLLYYGN